MYAVEFTPRAHREFEKLDFGVQQRITSALRRMTVRPFDFIERLSGSQFYKLRVGDYRVIIDVQESKLLVIVIHVGHRKNVYKGFIGG